MRRLLFNKKLSAEEIRNEAVKAKMFKMNSACLCSMVNAIGAKYGIIADKDASIDIDWDFMNEDTKEKCDAFCRLEGVVQYWADLISKDLIENQPLLECILKCLAKEQLASGKEYTEVADYFAEGRYVKSDESMSSFLYERAIALNYHPAIAKLFVFRSKAPAWSCNQYKDWESIYRHYKVALKQGLTEADLTALDPELVHIVRMGEKANMNDKEAFREIARNNSMLCFKYMKRLAKLGEEDGILYMSQYNIEQKGDLRKKESGLEWHIKGAELGNAECMYRAGRVYELTIRKTPEHIADAIRYHEMAAQKGIVESMYRLSRLYAQTVGGHYDQQKSDYFLLKAYEFGHKHALLSKLGKANAK